MPPDPGSLGPVLRPPRRAVPPPARRCGLPVLPLDVNASFEGFSVEMVAAEGGGAARDGAADGAASPPCPGPATDTAATDAVTGSGAAASTAVPIRPATATDPAADAVAAGGDTAPPLRPALRVGLKYVKEMSAAAMHSIVAARGDTPRDNLGRPVAGPSGALADRPGGATVAEPPGAAPSRPSAPRPPAGPPLPYTSLTDFVERSHVSIEVTENLVRAGAFESLGTRREELLASLPIVYACAHGERSGRRGGRTGYTAERAAVASLEPAGPQPLRLLTDTLPALDFLPSWTPQEVLRNELEVLGLNVSAHPLRFLRRETKALGVTLMARLPQVPHGRRVRVAGVLERAQMPWIRSGHRTLFLTLEDETELGQVVVFNDVYLKYGAILKDAIYLLVDGELQNDEEHGLAVVAHQVYDLLEVIGRPAAERPGAIAPHPSSPVPEHRWGDEGWMPWVEPRTRPGRTG